VGERPGPEDVDAVVADREQRRTVDSGRRVDRVGRRIGTDAEAADRPVTEDDHPHRPVHVGDPDHPLGSRPERHVDGSRIGDGTRRVSEAVARCSDVGVAERRVRTERPGGCHVGPGYAGVGRDAATAGSGGHESEQSSTTHRRTERSTEQNPLGPVF
jgi:hypothetical protein